VPACEAGTEGGASISTSSITSSLACTTASPA
jgi:hypothetical protein